MHGTFVKITTLLSYKIGYLSAEHFNILFTIVELVFKLIYQRLTCVIYKG